MRAREVVLTRGLVAVVDEADYALVTSGPRWHAVDDGLTHYARRTVTEQGRSRGVLMHSLITGWPLVDHVNGDGLDNRRANLRPATSSQNAQNRRVRSDSVSGLKGVRQRKRRGEWSGTWCAAIQVNGRRIHLGDFPTAVEAARAYDAAALEHFGEFARLNFPTAVAA